MPETPNSESDDYTPRFIILIFKVFIPFILIVTGLVLLVLRISGWSLVLGIPITTIGVVLIVYTYDEIVTKNLMPEDSDYPCSICGKPTPQLPGVRQGDLVCYSCKFNISRGLKSN